MADHLGLQLKNNLLTRLCQTLLKIEVIKFSPFDLLIYLRLVIIITIWEIFSTDFGGLEQVVHYSTTFYSYNPTWLYKFLLHMQGTFFGFKNAALVFQISTAFFFFLVLLKPNRITLAVAFLLLMILDGTACLYRYQTWDLDLSLVVIFFMLISPYSFKNIFSSNKVPSIQATTLGLMIAFYFGLFYLLAALSKFSFSMNWISQVQFGNYYFTKSLWYYQALPEPLNTISKSFSGFLLRYPFLGEFLAFNVVIDQLFWWLCIFMPFWRLKISFLVLFAHIGIFVMTGIFFPTLPLFAFCILIPWRTILIKSPVRLFDNKINTINANFNVFFLPLALMIACLAALVPAYTKNIYYPFANAYQFGWTYKLKKEFAPFYWLGVCGSDQQIHPLNINFGGFMVFRHLALINLYLDRLVNLSEAPTQTLNNLEILFHLTRPYKSNARFLGVFALPSHLLSSEKNIEFYEKKDFLILKGSVNNPTNPTEEAKINWEIIENLHFFREKTPGSQISLALPQVRC